MEGIWVEDTCTVVVVVAAAVVVVVVVPAGAPFLTNQSFLAETHIHTRTRASATPDNTQKNLKAKNKN